MSQQSDSSALPSLFEFADPRLMVIVDGYEIAYQDGQFFARKHELIPALEWFGTAQKDRWCPVLDGEYTVSIKDGTHLTKPLILGDPID